VLISKVGEDPRIALSNTLGGFLLPKKRRDEVAMFSVFLQFLYSVSLQSAFAIQSGSLRPCMVYNGDNYFSKKVKVKGPFSYFKEDDGREFFAVLVSDATACCSQGIEFVLKEESKYPDDYPKIGTDITVVGDFNYYKEDYNTYIQLTDAAMEVDNSLSWQ
jgi:hypothetical protein